MSYFHYLSWQTKLITLLGAALVGFQIKKKMEEKSRLQHGYGDDNLYTNYAPLRYLGPRERALLDPDQQSHEVREYYNPSGGYTLY